MMVRDEERSIAQAIRSVKPVVNEIIVVDTGSKDRTPEIASGLGAKVIRYKWDGNLGKARNVYVQHAGSEWILVLDADETIAKKDSSKLKKLIKKPRVAGYIFTRRDYIKTHDLLRNWRPNDGKYPKEEKRSGCPGWSPTKCIRLFRKSEGLYREERHSVHKDVVEFRKNRRSNIEECDIIIHHFRYLKGERFIEEKEKAYLRRELNYIKTSPHNPWSYLNIGITLFSLKEDNKAIKYLNKAVAINKKFAMAYFVLGMIYKEKAQYKKAFVNLKKAITIKPRYVDAWTVLGMAYIDRYKFKEAETSLKKALAIRFNHPLAHNNLGIVYENQGRLKEAEKEYKISLELHPQFADAYYNLAGLYATQGEFNKAGHNYRAALRINPADKEARAALKIIERERNR